MRKSGLSSSEGRVDQLLLSPCQRRLLVNGDGHCSSWYKSTAQIRINSFDWQLLAKSTCDFYWNRVGQEKPPKCLLMRILALFKAGNAILLLQDLTKLKKNLLYKKGFWTLFYFWPLFNCFSLPFEHFCSTEVTRKLIKALIIKIIIKRIKKTTK